MLTKTDTPTWVWYLNIGLFGLGYPIGLFHLFDRRPQIIINEIGIFDRTTYKDFINWSVIQDAYPIDISGQKFVCLVVDEKYEPSTKKGKAAKSFSNFSKEIGAQELNISLGQITIDEVKLTEFILTKTGGPKREIKRQTNNIVQDRRTAGNNAYKSCRQSLMINY
jgi:hypothetical protein